MENNTANEPQETTAGNATQSRAQSVEQDTPPHPSQEISEETHSPQTQGHSQISDATRRSRLLTHEERTRNTAVLQHQGYIGDITTRRVHIIAEGTVQRSQHSRGAEANLTLNVEISPIAPSIVDNLAGGDNAQRAIESLREIILCPVCFTVPYRMQIFCCRNGHSFCRQCLIHFRNTARTLLRRPICPVCRTSMVRQKVFRNFVAEQIIAEYAAIMNENGEAV